MVCAASKSTVRIMASPHFEMPPIRSISPDCLGVPEAWWYVDGGPCRSRQPSVKFFQDAHWNRAVRRIRVLLSIASLFAAIVCAQARAEVDVQQQAGEIRLQAQNATVAEILSALHAKLVKSSAASTSVHITGVYRGSLRQILSRVLEGYDYVIKSHGESVEVIVIGNGAPRAPRPAVIVHGRVD